MGAFDFMCDDLENARLNREHIKGGSTNDFYEEQRRSVAGWRVGEPCPKSIVLGELPFAGGKRQGKEEVE